MYFFFFPNHLYSTASPLHLIIMSGWATLSPAFPTNVCSLTQETDPISINRRKSRKSCPEINLQDRPGREPSWLALAQPDSPTWGRLNWDSLESAWGLRKRQLHTWVSKGKALVFACAPHTCKCSRTHMWGWLQGEETVPLLKGQPVLKGRHLPSKLKNSV